MRKNEGNISRISIIRIKFDRMQTCDFLNTISETFNFSLNFNLYMDPWVVCQQSVRAKVAQLDPTLRISHSNELNDISLYFSKRFSLPPFLVILLNINITDCFNCNPSLVGHCFSFTKRFFRSSTTIISSFGIAIWLIFHI